MKIAIIQASSQCEQNTLLFETVKKLRPQDEVINFGVFPEETIDVSYVETAICVGILLNSKAVDFVITGCTSGQGMMLACNALHGVLCGYIKDPSDAYLFGRINDGNAISLPLGLGFGWAGEINLMCTLEKLFDGPFGCGYPKTDASRKQADAALVKQLHTISKRSFLDVWNQLPQAIHQKIKQREILLTYIQKHGSEDYQKSIFS